MHNKLWQQSTSVTSSEAKYALSNGSGVGASWCSSAGCVGAEYLRLLREREKAAGLQGDPETDAYMKASALQGKRHSIVTEYMLRLLGLDVRPT